MAAAAPGRPRSRSPRRGAAAGQAGLQPGCRVRLHGLKGAADLNGQCGVAETFVSASGRWRVKLAAGQSKDIKPENIEQLPPEPEPAPGNPAAEQLHPGCTVRLRGLKSAVDLNGQEGCLDALVGATGRWRVVLRSGVTKDLKPENLELVEPEVMPVEPEVPAPPAPVQPEQPPGRAEQQSEAEQKANNSAADNLGFYIVCAPGARVNSGVSLNAQQISFLNAGTRVEVVEVTTLADCKRVRARIAQPPGWISLLATDTGHKFANRDESQWLSTEMRGPTYKKDGIDIQANERCGPNGRFIIQGLLGEGAYSTVWRCTDSFTRGELALKFTRADDVTRRALEREIQLMTQLSKHGGKLDPEGIRNLLCLAFLEGVEHKGHLGVLFEPMKCNLLSVLSKHGRGHGLPLLPTVRNFGKNLFLGLRCLRQAKLIHCDVKPENLLVSLDGMSVKLADFGCMMTVEEAEPIANEEWMPRFFRAPEVILGQRFSTQIDMWSAGATLYQVATDHFLFSGDTNNAILHEMLGICGAVPPAWATSGEFAKKHFDEVGNFLHHEATDFTVNVTKGHGASLGIEINNDTLVLEGVGDGLIKQWNLVNPRKAVEKGCRIVEVNGVRGAEKIFGECRRADVLNILVRRSVEALPPPQKVPMANFNPPPHPLAETCKTLLSAPQAEATADRHEFLVGHFSDLLRSCLCPDPANRADPKAALGHRFFAKGAGDPLADLNALWAGQAGRR